jgi:hypothetical protein
MLIKPNRNPQATSLVKILDKAILDDIKRKVIQKIVDINNQQFEKVFRMNLFLNSFDCSAQELKSISGNGPNPV